MISLNKRAIKLSKTKKLKTNITLENTFPSFSHANQAQSFSNIPNTRYIQPNNNIYYHNNNINTNSNLNYRDIKEIDIKNIPSEILSKNKTNRHKRNKLKNNIPIKTNSSYSYENISENSFPKYQNNTYTQRTIETYEIPLGKNYNNKYNIKERENKSMDITYYKPIIYINKNENNNSFCKKSENSDFFTQNNSFFMNGINLDDNINAPNINLNNTINYNNRQKNFISIPHPHKFKKKIPPIPIKKLNESNNNSFYFDENDNEMNNNININTITYTKKIKSGFSTDKNKFESTNVKTNIKTNSKMISNIKTKKRYSNKTYSLGYIKNIEKIGIQLSFSTNKIKNESIDLISPEILKNLKQYTAEKPDREIICSDLNENKVKEFNNGEIENKNIKIFNVQEDGEKAKKKKIYNKLSCYLLKHRKRKPSQKSGTKEKEKEKYNIIDIKEKIKQEKRNRSLSNFFKYKKKELYNIKESPSATYIKKINDIGGKIDLKFQSVKTKRYSIKKGIKRKIILNNLIKQCTLNKSPLDKGEMIINAAKTIQKWWRDLLSKISIILNIIKIQSIYRSYIIRKKILLNKNLNNLLSTQKKQNLIYKKIINKYPLNNNSLNNSKNSKSRNMNNNKISNIISNTSFKIVSNEDMNESIKSKTKEEQYEILIIDKNNMKRCFYTKECFYNGEKKIIVLQNNIKRHLKRTNRLKFTNKKIIKLPIILISFFDKLRYIKINNKKNINSPPIIKPTSTICLLTREYIYSIKKKPVVFSVTKMNYESIADTKNKNKTKEIKMEVKNRNQKVDEIQIIQSEFNTIEKLYQIPILNSLCYMNKMYIIHKDNKDKNEEKIKQIKKIQKLYKNFIIHRKKENPKIYKKSFILQSYMSKEYKVNKINSNKIVLNQKLSEEFDEKPKEKENKSIINDEINIKTLETFENYIDIYIKKYFINYIFNNLRKNAKISKQKYFLKMLIQRIKKIINQFSYEKLKLNDNKNDNNTEEYIFFFNVIKRHIKINEIDNKLNSDNEVVKLLKENIPDYFENYPNMKYIPYIKKKNDKTLVNQQLFLFDDEHLANYLFKCYQIEKNFLSLTPDIIKKRLILKPLKNQNIFTITRYMDNLYNDYMNNIVCKNCYCKNNELCLSGCKCHNKNNMIINNQLINLKNKDNNIDYENENLNINLTINEESSYINSQNKINKKISKLYTDRNSINSNLYSIKKFNTFTKYQKDIDSISNDDKNSVNTEYNNKNQHHKRINNFIRDFALRKKLRKSTISNLSNISNKNEEIRTINLHFNLNNNFHEKSSEKLNISIDDEQSNVFEEEDLLMENSIKKINTSLLKKKMKTIEPIPNQIRNLMRMATSFRDRQYKERRKKKETIKLRDSFVNYDYEYYEKI